MATKTLGIYDLGNRPVKVVMNNKGGGCVNWYPGRMLVMTIGLAGDWDDVVTWLLHESAEAVMLAMDLRWRPSTDFAASTGSCLFVCNHGQFTEVTARVGCFVAECLPDLQKAWKANTKKNG